MRKPLIVLFGEDFNDSLALESLIRALLPFDIQLDTKPLRKPPVLSRSAIPAKRANMAKTIKAFSSAAAYDYLKLIVVAHRDADKVEPAHIASAEELEQDLRSAGVAFPIAAVPCWEIEAWWMLFPEALRDRRTCWRPVDYSRQSVGMIEDAKERLIKDLRPDNVQDARRCRDFTESDGPFIAKAIKEGGFARDITRLRSMSLMRLRDRLFQAFNLDDP